MLTHPLVGVSAAVLLAAAVMACPTPGAAATRVGTRGRREILRMPFSLWALSTNAPNAVVTVRHTPVMAATLTALLDHADNDPGGWMLITEVEEALSDRHPGNGVRAALDRLSGITAIVEEEATDVLEVMDHPTETWTNRRTGAVCKRQWVRLSSAGYRWATDYVRNMQKGKRDRVGLRLRTAATRRSTLRTKPLAP